MTKLLTTAALLALASPVWAAADPQLLALLPPDAKIIAGFDAAGARVSPLGQFLLTRYANPEQLQELDALTGFDPRTDLQQIVLGGDGTEKDALVAARGSFEPAKIQSLGNPAGVHRGVTLIGGPDGTIAAFLDGTLALAGTRARVIAAIDRWVDGATATSALSAEAARVSASTHAWLACNDFSGIKPPAGAPQNPDPQAQMMQNLAATLLKVAGGLTFGEQSISATGQITARNAQDAQGLADLLKLLIGLAPADSPIPSNAFMIAAQGDTVNVSASVPQTLVEQMLSK